MNKVVLVALAVAAGHAAHAADLTGAWKLSGSVFFHAVDTTCHFKTEGAQVLATCENEKGPGAYTPATIAGNKVSWSWDPGPAVLTFDGTLTSDAEMKGDIKVRGFTGSFKANKQP